MANLKRTKRLIERHEADFKKLQKFYSTTVKRMNEVREESAKTQQGLRNNLKTVQLETEEKIEELENVRDGFKSRIAATRSHIDSLKLTLADAEDAAKAENS